MTPEGRVKQDVKALLIRYGAHQFWPVQTGYGAPTLDCIICHRGWYAAVETKAPGKKPTPRQQLTIEDMATAGGAVFVVGESKVDEFEVDTVGAAWVKIRYSGMEDLNRWLRSKL